MKKRKNTAPHLRLVTYLKIHRSFLLVTGAQTKAGTGLKMQDGPFFQRYIVRDISLTEIYRWLIEILCAILKRTRHGGQSRERL